MSMQSLAHSRRPSSTAVPEPPPESSMRGTDSSGSEDFSHLRLSQVLIEVPVRYLPRPRPWHRYGTCPGWACAFSPAGSAGGVCSHRDFVSIIKDGTAGLCTLCTLRVCVSLSVQSLCVCTAAPSRSTLSVCASTQRRVCASGRYRYALGGRIMSESAMLSALSCANLSG